MADSSQRKKIGLKTSIKLIYTSLLLCLALLLTCFTATGTIQAYQQFQQDHQRVQNGDVTTVSSWMTIPYVSHLYRVPEPCFTQTLNMNDHWLVRHATLRVLADDYQLPLSKLLYDVEHIILQYRRKQLTCGPPPPPTTIQATSTHVLPFSAWKGNAQ